MRGEERKIDRQINSAHHAAMLPRPAPRELAEATPPPRVSRACRAEIKQEELKVKNSIKQAAKKGDMSSAKMLAKEIVRSRKAVSRLHTSKAHMNSVVMQMQQQLAQQKVMGHMAKSTQVMAAMNRLVKVSDISETMQGMQKEMMKAGLIEEMVDDAMEGMEDEDDEDAADEEVDKVMQELNTAAFADSASAPTKQVQQQEAASEAAAEDDSAEEEMRARLAELRS